MKPYWWFKWLVGGAILLIAAILIENVRLIGSDQAPEFPAWQMTRFTGLLSYVLLFIGISLGIASGMPVWKGKQKAKLFQWHSAATISGTLCGLLHPMFLVIDSYEPFAWPELIIPFTTHIKPLIYGLGTVTAYGMLMLIITTDLRGKLSVKFWRTLHLCAYPLYLTALTHGMLGGTDTKNKWIYLMYIATFSIILVLMIMQTVMMNRRRRPSGLEAASGTFTR